MKLSNKKAKKILDFLTKRMGYESWELSSDIGSREDLLTLQFKDKDDFGIDLLIDTKNGDLNVWTFYNDTSLQEIVKLMLTNINDAYCCINHSNAPLCKELITKRYPWIHVFKSTDSIESLLIDADLYA